MATKTCPYCGEEIDARGFNIHLENCKAKLEGEKNKIDTDIGVDVILSESKDEPKKKKNFRTLEEDFIDSEAERKEDLAKQKARKVKFEEAEKSSKDHTPYLECPFCGNTQLDTNSREPGTAWCHKCGKAFIPIWK